MLWGLNKVGRGVGEDGCWNGSKAIKKRDMMSGLGFDWDSIESGRGLPQFLKEGLLIM